MAILDIFKEAKTDGFKVPAGTTAQRPNEPSTIRQNIDYGKLEFTADGINYTGLGGASGSGGDSIFYNNGQTVSTAYSIPANTNAMTAGKVTISAAVTVPTGSRWVIVG